MTTEVKEEIIQPKASVLVKKYKDVILDYYEQRIFLQKYNETFKD